MSNSCCLHLGGFVCWHPAKCTDPICQAQLELVQIRARLVRALNSQNSASTAVSERFETHQAQSVQPDV